MVFGIGHWSILCGLQIQPQALNIPYISSVFLSKIVFIMWKAFLYN